VWIAQTQDRWQSHTLPRLQQQRESRGEGGTELLVVEAAGQAQRIGLDAPHVNLDLDRPSLHARAPEVASAE
jgi:hypothetical protein